MSEIELSYCVVNTSQRELLVRGLDAIGRERESVPFATEVLVLDNGSRDGSAAAAGAHPAVDETIALEQRRGKAENDSELLGHGPWAVFHAITDSVVDVYLDVTDRIEADIDAAEEGVFSRSAMDVQRIYQLKRELVEFKRAVMPLARPLDALTSGHVPNVPMEMRRYIRDIADHHTRVTERVAGYDDLLSSILQASLAQVGVQQNNDMRKISAWVAIVAVPTMIAGIYGMNFQHMPELESKYGYPAALVSMAAACVLLYRNFKRRGWL